MREPSESKRYVRFLTALAKSQRLFGFRTQEDVDALAKVFAVTAPRLGPFSPLCPLGMAPIAVRRTRRKQVA